MESIRAEVRHKGGIGSKDFEKAIKKYRKNISVLPYTKHKGGHGLHKYSFGMQTMTAFNKKLLRGVQGVKREYRIMNKEY